MKKLCIVSEESLLGGGRKSGIAELSDSLAYTMSREYDVAVVTIYGEGGFAKHVPVTYEWLPGIHRTRMFGIEYYLVAADRWQELAGFAIADARATIVHNLAAPDLNFTAVRSVYTIDDARLITDPAKLAKYDVITTVSQTYAQNILTDYPQLAAFLQTKPFYGITNGILTEFFDPSVGHLIKAHFTADDLAGKRLCKEALCETYGIPKDRWIAVMLCRMVEDKGVSSVIDEIDHITACGGIVILAGPNLHTSAVSLASFPHPAQCLQLLAGADYFLSPSRYEPCGLMPMTAARYGCVPIVTQVGGLCDNFCDENAIIVTDTLSKAVEQAATIFYEGDTKLIKGAMSSDFSWDTRKKPYLDIYEGKL